MALKSITNYIVQDSNLKKYCVEVLEKTLNAFLTAKGTPASPVLIFKIESNIGITKYSRYVHSSGICLLLRSIVSETPGEEVTYGFNILHTYLKNMALSGNVDHLLSNYAKFTLETCGTLSAFWFYPNRGLANGYHDRVQFLRYCLEHLKNQN